MTSSLSPMDHYDPTYGGRCGVVSSEVSNCQVHSDLVRGDVIRSCGLPPELELYPPPCDPRTSQMSMYTPPCDVIPADYPYICDTQASKMNRYNHAYSDPNLNDGVSPNMHGVMQRNVQSSVQQENYHISRDINSFPHSHYQPRSEMPFIRASGNHFDQGQAEMNTLTNIIHRHRPRTLQGGNIEADPHMVNNHTTSNSVTNGTCTPHQRYVSPIKRGGKVDNDNAIMSQGICGSTQGRKGMSEGQCDMLPSHIPESAREHAGLQSHTSIPGSVGSHLQPTKRECEFDESFDEEADEVFSDEDDVMEVDEDSRHAKDILCDVTTQLLDFVDRVNYDIQKYFSHKKDCDSCDIYEDKWKSGGKSGRELYYADLLRMARGCIEEEKKSPSPGRVKNSPDVSPDTTEYSGKMDKAVGLGPLSDLFKSSSPIDLSGYKKIRDVKKDNGKSINTKVSSKDSNRGIAVSPEKMVDLGPMMHRKLPESFWVEPKIKEIAKNKESLKTTKCDLPNSPSNLDFSDLLDIWSGEDMTSSLTLPASAGGTRSGQMGHDTGTS